MFAVQVDGCVLRTVESLAGDGPLNVVQLVFHEYHALQCGYCTPGILMTVQALLDHERSRRPSKACARPCPETSAAAPAIKIS